MEGDEATKLGDSAVHLLHLHVDVGDDVKEENECAVHEEEGPCPEVDVLKANRIKRFTNPHQLDRSKVDPNLEKMFIAHLINRDVDGALELMRQNVTNQKLLLTSCALSAAIQIGNLSLVKAMILYPMVDFSNRQRAPVCEAVQKEDIRLTELLLLSPVTDVNKGCPLARAVELNNLGLVNALLASDRINPNKGGALYRAVGMGNVQIVEALLRHRKMNVNKFCGGVGSTPLCRAIDLQAEEMVRLLVSHPKIDINKGFLLTPLQHAVDAQAPQIVRILLTANTPTQLNPNKRMGGTASPLLLALKGKYNKEIVHLLLSHPGTEVGEDVFEVIERRSLYEVEDIILSTNRKVPLGSLWCSKVLCTVIGTFFVVMAGLLLIPFVLNMLQQKYYPRALLTMLVILIGNAGCYILLKKEPLMVFRRNLKLRLLPMWYDVYLCVMLLHSVFATTARVRRTELYPSGQINYKYQVLLVCVPMALIQTTLDLIERADSGSDMPAGLVYALVLFNTLAAAKLAISTVAKYYGDKRADEEMECQLNTPHGSMPIGLNPIDVAITPHSYTITTPDEGGTTEPHEPCRTGTPARCEITLSERRHHCPPELDLSLIQPRIIRTLPVRIKKAYGR